MKLKVYYLETYPDDDMGNEIDDNATFVGLLYTLYENEEVYDYIGVDDSVIRERLFSRLAFELKTPYDYVYNLWLEDKKSRGKLVNILTGGFIGD